MAHSLAFTGEDRRVGIAVDSARSFFTLGSRTMRRLAVLT